MKVMEVEMSRRSHDIIGFRCQELTTNTSLQDGTLNVYSLRPDAVNHVLCRTEPKFDKATPVILWITDHEKNTCSSTAKSSFFTILRLINFSHCGRWCSALINVERPKPSLADVRAVARLMPVCASAKTGPHLTWIFWYACYLSSCGACHIT